MTWGLGNGLNGWAKYDWAGRASELRVCASAPSENCSPQPYGVNASQVGTRVTWVDDTVRWGSTAYGYDEFGRLTSSSTNFWNASPQQNFSYVYDRYGNRAQQNAPQGGPAPQFLFDKTDNQIAGFTYDPAGNMTSDGTHSYTYDAEGNVLQVDGGATASYTYDALNHRVQAVTNGTSVVYAYNLSGQRVASFDSSGNPISNQIYSGNAPLAFYNGGQIHYQHQDWLGTERVRTNASGITEGTYMSLSFGDGYSPSGSDSDAYHFAGLDQDADYTHHAEFRQYSSTQGRWLSPDAYSGSYSLADPQSFNRYTYVRNNPLDATDPSGLMMNQDDSPMQYGYISDSPGCEGDWACVDSFNGDFCSWCSGFSVGPVLAGTGGPVLSVSGAPTQYGQYSVPYPGLIPSIWQAAGLPDLSNVGCNPICDAIGDQQDTSLAPNNGTPQTPKPDCTAAANAASKEAFDAAKSNMPNKWTVGGRVVVGGILVGAARGAKGGWAGAAAGAAWGAVAGAATAYGTSIYAYATGVVQWSATSSSCNTMNLGTGWGSAVLTAP